MGAVARRAALIRCVRFFTKISYWFSVGCNPATVAGCNNLTTAPTIIYADTFPAVDQH
jgi:hypothetical protein